MLNAECGDDYLMMMPDAETPPDDALDGEKYLNVIEMTSSPSDPERNRTTCAVAHENQSRRSKNCAALLIPYFVG